MTEYCSEHPGTRDGSYQQGHCSFSHLHKPETDFLTRGGRACGSVSTALLGLTQGLGHPASSGDTANPGIPQQLSVWGETSPNVYMTPPLPPLLPNKASDTPFRGKTRLIEQSKNESIRSPLLSKKEKYQDARRKNTVSCTIFTAGIVLDFIIHGII